MSVIKVDYGSVEGATDVLFKKTTATSTSGDITITISEFTELKGIVIINPQYAYTLDAYYNSETKEWVYTNFSAACYLHDAEANTIKLHWNGALSFNVYAVGI